MPYRNQNNNICYGTGTNKSIFKWIGQNDPINKLKSVWENYIYLVQIWESEKVKQSLFDFIATPSTLAIFKKYYITFPDSQIWTSDYW